MRRTKPTLIYRRTKNLRAVQPLLGHTKLNGMDAPFLNRHRGAKVEVQPNHF
jgi:hypothetical protein